MTLLWIVGSSGLLGSSVASAARTRPDWRIIEDHGLDWSLDATALGAQVRERTEALLRAAGDDRWAIVWAAGAVVPASTDAEAEAELAAAKSAFRAIAETIVAAPPGTAGRGAILLASSAGGVYAGSADPPFTETTVPVPTSPYGELKLGMERTLATVAGTAGIPTVIARIANLYGPGQDLGKQQGLISHLAKSRYGLATTSIYVPLDTLRDYLHVDDAAAMVLDALELAAERGGVTTKILCSGASATISTLLKTITHVTHGRPRVVLGTSELAARQATDLRLRSTVWTELDRREFRGLAEGVASAANGVLAAVQDGRVS